MSFAGARHLTLLDEFLVDSFDGAELVRFFDEQFGAAFVAELPGTAASPRSLAFHAVRCLHRHGKINEQLITALSRARPARVLQLQGLSRCLVTEESKEQDQQTVVWRRAGQTKENPRIQLVEALEEQVLLRERSTTDNERRRQAEQAIDTYTRRLRTGSFPAPGNVVAGTRLEQPIDSGNFGTVWRSRRLDTGEVMATKIFNLDKLSEGVMLWRFRRSIRALTTLSSYRAAPRSIPRIVEVAPDTLAFSMRYLSEGTLEQIERRGWSLTTKLAIFLEVAGAVAFAHQIGIVHRDIKPANILLDEHLHPVLIDYDIADIRFVTQLSVARGGLGTPVFAAPEQLERADDADERSDIYSLGRLLHYLLLERSPGYQIERDPSLENLRGQPPGLIAVIRKATQWDPQRRFAAVPQMIADIERCQSGLAVFRARALACGRWFRHNVMMLTTSMVITGAASYTAAVERDRARAQEELAEVRAAAIHEIRGHAVKVDGLVQEIRGRLDDIRDIRGALSALDLSEADESVRKNVLALREQLDGVRSSLDASSSSVQAEQERISGILNATATAPAPAPEETIARFDAESPATILARASKTGANTPWIRLEASETVTHMLPSELVDGPAEATAPRPRPPPPVIPPPIVQEKRLYNKIERDLNAQLKRQLHRCVQDDRYLPRQDGLHLELAISAVGDVSLIGVEPQVGAETTSCIKHSLTGVHAPTTKPEKYEYTLKL